jgi:hypothetical protein
MPRDVRGEKVENFRLTKEQMDFQRKTKSVNQIRLALQLKLGMIRKEADNLKVLYDALEQEAQGIQIPQEPIKELPGMNFGEEETISQRVSEEKFSLNY